MGNFPSSSVMLISCTICQENGEDDVLFSSQHRFIRHVKYHHGQVNTGSSSSFFNLALGLIHAMATF